MRPSGHDRDLNNFLDEKNSSDQDEQSIFKALSDVSDNQNQADQS